MSTLTLSLKIDLLKVIREKFLGKHLWIDVLSVIEGVVNFGIVENVDFADEKLSVWGPDSRVFWLNVNDIINVNFTPNERDVCLLIEAKNNVEVRFMVE